MKCKSPKKLLSLLLVFVMAVTTMAVPAMAADVERSVTVTYNGTQVFREDYPDGYVIQNVALADIGVGVDVSISINSDAAATPSRPISMTGKLTNGTSYRLTENSSRVVSLSTDNGIKDDMTIAITTTPHNYTITANSGPKGFKSDLGSTGNPTCTVSTPTQSVEGNTGWSVTFTPNAGMNITHLNIRSALNGQNVVAISTNSVTVGNTKVAIEKAANGMVTVSSTHAADNLYITALTGEKPAQYTLSVATDGHSVADVASATMDVGSTRKVTFTADPGYLIDSISIVDGGKNATLNMVANSVSVNGHSYSVARSLDGKVVLSVPAISANVSVSASASANKAYLQIEKSSDVDCNYSGISYLDKGNYYNIRLDPDDDTEITSVKIESATDSAVVKPGDYRFVLDGVYYSVDNRYDTGMTLYINSMPGNLKVTVNDKDAYHTVTLYADGGADYEDYDDELRVEDGGSTTFAFVPDSGNTIEELVFTYQGHTYKVDSDDSYIRINGTRCPITWESNGRVVVTLYNVEFDITVKANTDYDGKDYVVTVQTDGGATYSGSSKVYVDSGTSKTITFTPSGRYSIQELVITRKGSTYRVDRGDSYITINGTRHSVTWASSGKVSITLKNITADMSVTANTTYGGTATTSYKVTKSEDSHSTISLSTNSSTVYAGQALTVTVTPDNNYYLRSVTLKLGSTTKTLYTTTNSFVYNGYTYSVYHYSDGSMSIYFPELSNDLTVTSKTTRGTDPNLNDVVISTPVTTPDTTSNYHSAYIAGYGNGLFMPYGTTTRAQALVMLVRAFYGATDTSVAQSYASSPFNDVPSNAWYAPYVAYAYNQGILTGTHGVGSNFRPQEPITRAEYTEWACRFMGIVPSGIGGYNFSDVPANHWASSTIAYAASQGWVNGYGDGTFVPDRTITRAALVSITNRVLGRKADWSYISSNYYGLTTFTDVPATFWAYADIMEAANGHYYTNYSGVETWNY